ncbi:phosphoglycerate mutase [Deinococcus aetherius]|uniref:Phosphoglycerate mutase n=1 Tax=Deinococcus aetherius TaxID=200252 RepID=A0ABN6RIT4_9DEIO|nr:histidine phosphatase family protein [Deinococcus aetherius]BDP41606.1 phosphoglycerate mutase [Deinococcus aetherius]
MPASRVFLVRHGQTAANVSRVLRGPSGEGDPLDSAGETQARLVAAHLAALHLQNPRVYASSYRRARETARPVADALGVPLHILDGVHEIDPGDWVGRPYDDLRTHALRKEDGTLGFPGGESLEEVGERFHRALNGLPPGETPIIVSHGGALTAGLAALLRVPVAVAWTETRFAHPNAALTELERHGEGWHVVRLADVRHLKELMPINPN